MTEIDTAWLAGLLEGEGSFMWHMPSPTISLHMTDRDVVERVSLIFGRRLRGPYRHKNPKHKPYWCASLGGPKALELMTTILPRMGERRTKQINAVIDTYLAYSPPTRVGFAGKPFHRARAWATCHPHRRPVGGGLCQMCYMREWRKGITQGREVVRSSA